MQPSDEDESENEKSLIQEAVEELFSFQERSIIWAALKAYDVGPKEANPTVYEELEAIRKDLEDAFDT